MHFNGSLVKVNGLGNSVTDKLQMTFPKALDYIIKASYKAG